MAIKTDSDGYLLAADGTRETDGNGNFFKPFTQVALDGIIGNRVTDMKKKLEEAHKAQITNLEAQIEAAKKSGNPAEAEELRKQLAELEQQVLSASQIADRRAADARRESEQKAKDAMSQADYYKNAFTRTTISNEIIAEAGNRQRGAFNDPSDLVNLLSGASVVEEEKDATGHYTGKLTVRYKLMVPTEKGDATEEKILTVAEAADVIRKQKPYLLRGSNTGGSGQSGRFDNEPINSDLSKMSPMEKMAAGYRTNDRNRR